MLITSEPRNTVAIRCEGIGKQYRIGRQVHNKNLRETLTQAAYAPVRRFASMWHGQAGGANDSTVLWALKDISLELRHGEVLGIIGRNGSGKSTLLKILSRITKPTEGQAEIQGRLGSLLEVGAGFHMELTGRENIFLNGAVLGMTRREIQSKFDEIVEFSECGRFLDTAVKHYSSGMSVRLAFAVAAHLETEIMLVDEVLAVGDAAFQKKCLGKMGDAASQGRTVVFVSHNMLAVEGLCTRAVCLHDGRVILEGTPAAVTSQYLQNWLPKSKDVVYEDIKTAPGNDIVRLRRVCIRPQNGTSGDRITVRTPFVVEFEYWKLAARINLDLVAEVSDEHGLNVFTTASLGETPDQAGLLRSSFFVPADLMNNGNYSICLAAVRDAGTIVERWEDIAGFEVQDIASELRGHYHGDWAGVVRPHLRWNTELVEPSPAPVAGVRALF